MGSRDLKTAERMSPADATARRAGPIGLKSDSGPAPSKRKIPSKSRMMRAKRFPLSGNCRRRCRPDELVRNNRAQHGEWITGPGSDDMGLAIIANGKESPVEVAVKMITAPVWVPIYFAYVGCRKAAEAWSRRKPKRVEPEVLTPVQPWQPSREFERARDLSSKIIQGHVSQPLQEDTPNRVSYEFVPWLRARAAACAGGEYRPRSRSRRSR